MLLEIVVVSFIATFVQIFIDIWVIKSTRESPHFFDDLSILQTILFALMSIVAKNLLSIVIFYTFFWQQRTSLTINKKNDLDISLSAKSSSEEIEVLPELSLMVDSVDRHDRVKIKPPQHNKHSSLK